MAIFHINIAKTIEYITNMPAIIGTAPVTYSLNKRSPFVDKQRQH